MPEKIQLLLLLPLLLLLLLGMPFPFVDMLSLAVCRYFADVGVTKIREKKLFWLSLRTSKQCKQHTITRTPTMLLPTMYDHTLIW